MHGDQYAPPDFRESSPFSPSAPDSSCLPLPRPGFSLAQCSPVQQRNFPLTTAQGLGSGRLPASPTRRSLSAPESASLVDSPSSDVTSPPPHPPLGRHAQGAPLAGCCVQDRLPRLQDNRSGEGKVVKCESERWASGVALRDSRPTSSSRCAGLRCRVFSCTTLSNALTTW